MRPRAVVLTSVVLSVLASAVIATLLGRDRSPSARSSDAGRASPPPHEVLPAPDAAARTDTSLEERVRRIEARLDAWTEKPARRSTREAIDALLAITRGERQVAIADSFRELVGLGDGVVPEIVALLESGRDQDWGGGFSISGNLVRGYPRLRTLLIDVLRQIGTPEAHQGLLDALRLSGDATDYRDVFMLFRVTSDEIMVKGMTGMLPAAVRCLKDEDPKKASLLTNGVQFWVHQHDFEGKVDLVFEMARLGFEPGRWDRTSFGLLVGLAPERAFELTQQVREKLGERALYTVASVRTHDAPRAQIVRYLDMLFASEITESERLAFYAGVPRDACETIQPPSARAADARVLLDFLKRRLAVETSPGTKTVLADRIATLESALRQ